MKKLSITICCLCIAFALNAQDWKNGAICPEGTSAKQVPANSSKAWSTTTVNKCDATTSSSSSSSSKASAGVNTVVKAGADYNKSTSQTNNSGTSCYSTTVTYTCEPNTSTRTKKSSTNNPSK